MAILLEEKPTIIIGPERSGTTLLMAMIGCHPRIAVPEVVWYYPRFRPYLFTFGDLSKPENLYTLAEEMVFGLKTPFWGMKVNPRTIVDEILADLREQSFAGIYCAMMDRFAKHEDNKPRWGEKTPYNLFFVEQIKQDFPNAQFIYITRDGRDTSADYLQSGFGPTNIFCAAETWKLCQNAVEKWRDSLSDSEWMDVRYEELVAKPEPVLKQVCQFLGEEYSPSMMDFYKTDLAQTRGATRDHKPLGGPVSDQYIGIYKELLSIAEQRIFVAVAGEELKKAGYEYDIEPATITEEDKARYRELDGRTRAATMDAQEGHIVYESYNDWLIDQREQRRQAGIWDLKDVPDHFPIGHPNEEMIIGQRAWRYWKDYFCIKPQYKGKKVVL